MKKILLIGLMCFTLFAEARGGISSGGRGGFSSASAVRTSPHISAPAPRMAPPAPAPSANRGGFNSAQRPTTAVAAPPRTTTTTTTTTSVQRSRYATGPGIGYGGFGMGYGYANGMLTGMLIGGMLHPHNTVMYAGPGMYANNALLYPDGRVVNQQGVHVGNYVNNVFVPVTGGAVVAQTIPQEVAPRPVVLHDPIEKLLTAIVCFLLIIFIAILIVGLIL